MDEEQKAAQKTPAFVLSEDAACFDIELLERTTGMLLAAPEGLERAALVSGTPSKPGSSGAIKWCPDCPHVKRNGTDMDCFTVPSYAGPLPPVLYANKDALGRDSDG